MRSRKLAIGIGLLLAIASPVSAFAQGALPVPYPSVCPAAGVSPAKSDEAHAFYNAGRALYDEGNYDGAISQFREAYKRDCSKHELLIIISRSYELKGDRVEAVRALETFLDRVKDAPDGATHRTKIDNLKKQIAAQPPPTVTSPSAPPPPPPVVVVREHTVPPWIVVGLGSAVIAAGLIVVAVAPSLPKNCDATTKTCTPDPTTTQSDADRQSAAGRSQTQPTVGALVAGGGLALLVGGLLWHFLEPTGPVTTGTTTGALKPSITPALSPSYAGMTLGSTF